MADTPTHVVNKALIKIGENKVNSIDGTEERAVKAKDIYEGLRDELIGSHPWKFATKRTRLKAAGILDCSSIIVTITDASPDTIVLSATESFVTAGFELGDRVHVSGSDNNNGFFDVSLVTAPVALTLTLDSNEEITAETLTLDTDLKLYLSPSHKYDFKYSKPSDAIRIDSVNEYGTDMAEPHWEEEGAYIVTSELDARDQIDIVYMKQIIDTTKMPVEFVNAWAAYLAAELAQTLSGKRTLRADLFNEMDVHLDRAYERNAMRDNKDRSKRRTSWQKAGR